MKWIKVSQKSPLERFGAGPEYVDIHFKTYLGDVISYSSWWLTSNDTITFNQPAPRPSQTLSRDSVYWLDESETIITYQEAQWLEYKKGNQSFRQYLENVYPDDFPTGSKILFPPETIPDSPYAPPYPTLEYILMRERYDDLEEEFSEFRFKVDKLLAEQHRNTRHDAIEAVQKHWRESYEYIFECIERDIMNLKQRKPS